MVKILEHYFGKNGLSLIIPAYNEEQRIEPVLLRLCQHFENQEIIVVCNGCVDGTQALVGRVSRDYPQIRLLHFNHKLGKGAAIINGFKIAQGNVVGFVDADESVDSDDVARMYESLSDCDGVIASRRLNESVILVRQPFRRRIASRVFNILVRMMFNLNFKDTQCGAKLFRKEVISSILDELNTKGFEFDVELLWKLRKRNFEIKEFPITWKHSENSRFSLKKTPEMFFSLVKVRLWNQSNMKKCTDWKRNTGGGLAEGR